MSTNHNSQIAEREVIFLYILCFHCPTAKNIAFELGSATSKHGHFLLSTVRSPTASEIQHQSLVLTCLLKKLARKREMFILLHLLFSTTQFSIPRLGMLNPKVGDYMIVNPRVGDAQSQGWGLYDCQSQSWGCSIPKLGIIIISIKMDFKDYMP